MYEKSEQPQNDISVNSSLDNHGDSLFAVSHDQVLKCELQQWDIKPDPYLQLQQYLTPDLSSDQQYQGNIPIVFQKL